MKYDLKRETSINISLGHLVVTWNLISEKLAGEPYNSFFSEEEKRAIWCLQDIIEQEIVEQGIGSMSGAEWEILSQEASEHINTLKIDYLD